MNDYFSAAPDNAEIPEFKRKIVPHDYSWRIYKCETCGREKKISSIIFKLYSAPKCCGKEMECIATKK
ncbi:MAG: hypothetical protein IJX24_04135 [Oscillospiraceae bacterium]|nr:hypothetical protein [Oscillospiraceae bacterium]